MNGGLLSASLSMHSRMWRTRQQAQMPFFVEGLVALVVVSDSKRKRKRGCTFTLTPSCFASVQFCGGMEENETPKLLKFV